MATRAFSRPPSPYPRVLFHTIRVSQFISSAIVMSILGYFVFWLAHDHYYIPWTFILLLSVSAFTVASILITSFFYYMRSLKPGLSVYINGFLSLIWMAGFALLTWNISVLLGNVCNVDNWDHDTGIMICRIYKALETFSITGMLSTLAALVLDIDTLRKATRLGRYNAMGGNEKRPLRASAMAATNDFSHDMRDEHHGYREPSLEFPEYSHEMQRPNKPQRPIESTNFGYQAPTEQTQYDGPSTRLVETRYDSGGA